MPRTGGDDGARRAPRGRPAPFAEALRVYDGLRSLLRSELGIAPGAATIELQARLVKGDVRTSLWQVPSVVASRSVLYALSAAHKIGLGVAGGVFIAFALASAVLIPRARPDFPGKGGLRPFVALTAVLFVGMLFSVEFFGKESAEKAAAGEKSGTAETSAQATAVKVSEKEFRITLPSTSLKAGRYRFELTNDGKVGHDLVVAGPGVKDARTPVIAPGKSATLGVTLEQGAYKLYCSVPGHEAAGMKVQVTVS